MHAEQAALGLIDALQGAYSLLGRHPATGSSRYAHELDVPGLRTWPLNRSPYLVFYVERDDHVDFWRVLHTRRDIPALMQESARIAINMRPAAGHRAIRSGSAPRWLPIAIAVLTVGPSAGLTGRATDVALAVHTGSL